MIVAAIKLRSGLCSQLYILKFSLLVISYKSSAISYKLYKPSVSLSVIRYFCQTKSRNYVLCTYLRENVDNTWNVTSLNLAWSLSLMLSGQSRVLYTISKGLLRYITFMYIIVTHTIVPIFYYHHLLKE
jgi:hypothetical protein